MESKLDLTLTELVALAKKEKKTSYAELIKRQESRAVLRKLRKQPEQPATPQRVVKLRLKSSKKALAMPAPAQMPKPIPFNSKPPLFTGTAIIVSNLNLGMLASELQEVFEEQLKPS